MKFHFSGICGAGMGNVASLLVQLGHEVKGSDQHFFPPMSQQLSKLGIKTYQGYSERNLTKDFTPDVQVISNSLSKNHIEVQTGTKANWEISSFPEVIKQFILPGRESFVVAGTHGKTTTSSILAQMLSPLEPGYFIGGVLKSGQTGAKIGRPHSPFILEGDEYDTSCFDKHSKFLHYQPKNLILTHLEWDHVDIFPNFQDMINEFQSLLNLLPENAKVLYCGDQEQLKGLMASYQGFKKSYGFGNQNDIKITSVSQRSDNKVLEIEDETGTFELETPLIGNIYHLNLLGAYGMAKLSGISHPSIQASIAEFSGAKRRLELLKQKPFKLYSDFAHHPTAILETLSSLRNEFPNAYIWAVFDPRNATSRRSVFEEALSQSFLHADQVTIGPPYPDQKLKESEQLNVKSLADKIGPKATGCQNEQELRDSISNIPNECILIIMSCGGFFGLIQELSESSP